MPKSNEKTIKKAVRTTTEQTAKAPNKGTETKSNKIDRICQIALKSINIAEKVQKDSIKKAFGQTSADFDNGVNFTYGTIKQILPTALKIYLQAYEKELFTRTK